MHIFCYPANAIQQDAKAIAAIRAEGDALIAAKTWLQETVVTKDDLIARSIKMRTPIHLGDLLTICGIKHWEDPSCHKYKGRICYQGNCGKDEFGKAAVYQDLSSSPTSMFDANANLAYGACPGHVSTAADAVRAYVQSILKSARETWVVIPYELWPRDGSWEKKGFHWNTFQGNAWRSRSVCATQLAEVQALEALQPYHCHWVRDIRSPLYLSNIH